MRTSPVPREWTAEQSAGQVVTARFMALANASSKRLDTFLTTWLYTGRKAAVFHPASAQAHPQPARQQSAIRRRYAGGVRAGAAVVDTAHAPRTPSSHSAGPPL